MNNSIYSYNNCDEDDEVNESLGLMTHGEY